MMPAGESRRELRELAGLRVAVAGDGRLHLGDDVRPVEPDVRRLSDMTPVLYDPDAPGPDEMYYMYRGVMRPEDAAAFAAHDMRYDITVLVPGQVGVEYVKTAGHYHDIAPETGLPYPELYQVISGRACYILQRPAGNPSVVEAVAAVDAGPLDTVLVPPGYGHVTVNAGTEPLVMANLVQASFSSLYDEYRRRGGAAYYVVRGGDARAYVSNRNYDSVGGLRMVAAREWPDAGMGGQRPLYRAFLDDPGRYQFLVRPQDATGEYP